MSAPILRLTCEFMHRFKTERALAAAIQRRQRDGDAIYVCRCDCGNTIQAFASDLTSGAIKDCVLCSEKTK